MRIQNYKRPTDTLSQFLRSDFSSLRRRERLIPVPASYPPVVTPAVIPSGAIRDEDGSLYRDEFGTYWVM